MHYIVWGGQSAGASLRLEIMSSYWHAASFTTYDDNLTVGTAYDMASPATGHI
jgi:hypothetical protein